MISFLSQISICPIYPRLDNFSSGVNGIKLPSTLDTTASNSLLTLTGLTNDLPIRHFSETVKLHTRQLHDPIETITVMGAMMHPAYHWILPIRLQKMIILLLGSEPETRALPCNFVYLSIFPIPLALEHFLYLQLRSFSHVLLPNLQRAHATTTIVFNLSLFSSQ